MGNETYKKDKDAKEREKQLKYYPIALSHLKKRIKKSKNLKGAGFILYL